MLVSWKDRVTISVEISNLLMGLVGEFREMSRGSGRVALVIAKLPYMGEMSKNELETGKDIRRGGRKGTMVNKELVKSRPFGGHKTPKKIEPPNPRLCHDQQLICWRITRW